MEELIVTELLEKKCLRPFEINLEHALEAADYPDRTEVIERDRLTLRVHLKRIDAGQPPYHLIVVEQIQQGERRGNYALKAYPDLCEDFESKSPLEIIQAIADRFGVNIKIGQRRGKFIFEERIPVKGLTNIVSAEADKRSRHKFTLQLYCRIDEGPPKMADCALGFCLDVTKYTAWLHTHTKR